MSPVREIIKEIIAITRMQSLCDNEEDGENQLLMTILNEKSRIQNCTYIDSWVHLDKDWKEKFHNRKYVAWD